MKIYDGDGDGAPPVGGTEAGERWPVGVAEFEVVADATTLVTSGLGSCVAVGITDGRNATGLIHVMLPSADGRAVDNPAKFADTGLATMIDALEAAGAARGALFAKVAGGSQMITFRSQSRSIGERNVEAVRRVLEIEGVPIVGEDVGGDAGRSVEFSRSGEMLVRTARFGRRAV